MIKLSKDINNIIYKYLDYSIKNLKLKIKLYKNMRRSTFKLYSYITIEDILFKCVNKGYSGFYIEEHYTYIIDQLIDLIVVSNYDIEVSRDDKKCLYYYNFSKIINYDSGIRCHLLSLNLKIKIINLK